MGILIRGNYGTCDSCGKSEEINVILAGDLIKESQVVELDLCGDCIKTLHLITEFDEDNYDELEAMERKAAEEW